MAVLLQRKGAQTIFVNRLGSRLRDEGKGGIRKFLPYREIGLGDRQPAERKQIAAGFGNAPDLGPGDLVNRAIDHSIRLSAGSADRSSCEKSAMIPLECGFGKEKRGPQ